MSKNFLNAAILGLALSSILKSADSLQPHLVCSNTTITQQQLANLTALKIQSIKRVWNVTLARDVPAKTRDYGNLVIDLIDIIDSLSVQIILLGQATLVSAFVTNSEDVPGLCEYTRYLNASLENARTGKACKEVAETLQNIALITPQICTLISVGALCDKGCKNLPSVPRLDSKCFRRGRAYDMVGVLDEYGKNLPYSIRVAIEGLYNSKELIDNYVAISSAIFMPEELFRVFDYLPDAELHEILTIATDTIPPRCCKTRQKRLEALCVQYNASVAINIQHVVDELLYDDDWDK